MSGLLEIATITLILMIAGGFIAWLGDRLGTYVGKKRLSKFGLRPRHTAMLYTIFSGIFIALSTFFLLIWLNYGFRNALLHGKALDQQIAKQKSDLRFLTSKNTLLEEQIKTASAAAQDAVKEKIVADHKRDESIHTMKVAQAELSKSQVILIARQNDLKAAKLHLVSVEGNLNSTEFQLRTARYNVANATVQVKKALGSYQYEQGRVASLKQVGAQLASRNTTLQQTNNDLETRTTELTTQHLIFSKNQEVGRIVITTDQSAEIIKKKLKNWLGELSGDADKLKGAAGRNGRTVLVESIPSGQSANAPAVPEDVAIDSLSQLIASEKGVVSSVVVIADAKYNTFVGDQTKIELHPFDNILAFSKGEEIASQLIDGAQPDDVVLTSLIKFLKGSVRPIAAPKIIPIYDRATGQYSYGEPIEPWAVLIKEIQSAGANAKITAVADEDTYTRGPLKIRLIITENPSIPILPAYAPPPSSLISPDLSTHAVAPQGVGDGK